MNLEVKNLIIDYSDKGDNMSRIELIREIETDYKLYKENGGELGIIAFTVEWLKHHKKAIKEGIKND